MEAGRRGCEEALESPSRRLQRGDELAACGDVEKLGLTLLLRDGVIPTFSNRLRGPMKYNKRMGVFISAQTGKRPASI